MKIQAVRMNNGQVNMALLTAIWTIVFLWACTWMMHKDIRHLISDPLGKFASAGFFNYGMGGDGTKLDAHRMICKAQSLLSPIPACA